MIGDKKQSQQRSKFGNYWSLIKSLQTGLLLFTGIAGYTSAQCPVGETSQILGLSISLFLAIAGSTVLNMVWDRDIDSRMQRTSHRPLVNGEIQVVHALMFGILLQGTGDELLSNIKIHKGQFALLASMYGSIARLDNDKSNDCKGIYFSKQASKYDLSGAQYDVAIYYDKGKGVKQDWEKAKEWYKKSISTDDNPLALCDLANMYEEEGNVKKAVYWYKRLVDSKNPKKQFFQNFVNHAKKRIEFYGGMKI